MKHFFALIFCVMCATLMVASASVHLEFEGLPICGDKENFSKELEKKGYKRSINDDFVCHNNGIFNNSTIRLIEFGRQNQVQSICVFLPQCDSWDSLMREYDKWERYLAQQYGNAIENKAEFKTLSTPQTSEDKMRALKKGECHYTMVFQSTGGIISLLLNYTDDFGYCPQLIYMDDSVCEDLLNQMTHLNFMGIPITGTVESFITELKKKNFRYQTSYDRTAVLQGNFAGYKDCNILVKPIEGQNVVYAVAVIFPECNNWDKVYFNYTSIKSMLIKKYGDPSKCVEIFQSSTQPSDDQMKWNYAIVGRCDYSAVFELDTGSISLSICDANIGYNNYCYVELSYLDRQNAIRSISNEMNDL